MAVITTAVQLDTYEIRWLCGIREGGCWIRAASQNDAIRELHANASWYGCQTDRPRVVWAVPVGRIERRLNGRL